MFAPAPIFPWSKLLSPAFRDLTGDLLPELPSLPHQPLEFTYPKRSFGGSTEEHDHLSAA